MHGMTARLGSEVKDGAVARQVEDAANELQRQMGEFERNVCEHMKTLDLTCRLQRAMEEVPQPIWINHNHRADRRLTHLLLCVLSISSGVMRPAPPSLGSGSFLRSVAAQKQSRFCTVSLRSSFGPQFPSRRRGSGRSQSWLSGCTVHKNTTNRRLLF